MTKEFKNLLDLLKSDNPDNVYLAFTLAQNFKKEFEKYIKCSLEDYEELYHFLIEHKMKYAPTESLLTEIKKISLIGKQKFEKLPKSVKILNKLAYLDLSYQLLKELPVEIGKLKNLKQIVLSANLPESLKNIERIKQLEVLSIDDIDFKVFPQELMRLKKLTNLCVSGEFGRKFKEEFKILKENNKGLDILG